MESATSWQSGQKAVLAMAVLILVFAVGLLANDLGRQPGAVPHGTALDQQQAADEKAIQGAAAQLAASGFSADELRQAALAELGRGRNDAVVGRWLLEPETEPPARQIERYAAFLQSSERRQLALGLAGVRLQAGRLHQLLLRGMPAKAIVISIHDQQLSAYERGKTLLTTPVTTGRVPELATDVGPMRVLRKDAPWTMHSPWPKGSPDWYPDTVVQMVLWFTDTGEGMHDAAWQTLPYGPGSETGPAASHGCVHVPFDAERTLFTWANPGTPVIVYPGDGSPVEAQLAQRSVDADGHPTGGPRGA